MAKLWLSPMPLLKIDLSMSFDITLYDNFQYGGLNRKLVFLSNQIRYLSGFKGDFGVSGYNHSTNHYPINGRHHIVLKPIMATAKPEVCIATRRTGIFVNRSKCKVDFTKQRKMSTSIQNCSNQITV